MQAKEDNVNSIQNEGLQNNKDQIEEPAQKDVSMDDGAKAGSQ